MTSKSISSLVLLSTLSGLLLGFGHVPGVPWVGFFGLVPLIRLWCLDLSDERLSAADLVRRFLRGFLSGWIAQSIQFVLAAHWLLTGIREFGIKSPLLSLAVFLAIAATNTLSLPLAGGLIQGCAPAIKGRLGRVLFAASVLIFFELGLSSFIPAPLGHIAFLTDVEWRWGEFESSTMPMIQLTDLVGLSGISLIIALFSSLLALGNRKGIYGAAVLLIGANIIGGLHGHRWMTPPKRGESVHVLLVQSFTSNDEKRMIDSPLVAHAMVNRQIQITQRRLQRAKASRRRAPDLVIWPETAVPDALDDVYAGGVLPRTLKEFVHRSGVPLMTGAFSRDPRTHREANAVFVLDDRAIPSRPYLKTKLFPIAETLPLATWFPRIRNWFPQLTEYSDSAGERVIRVGKLRAGLSICYETLFNDWSREAVQSGANALFNLSNEAWFKSEIASRQFIAFARARAIEARLPLVRVSNYANTLVMTPGGQVGAALVQAGAGELETEIFVEPHGPPTLFIASPGLTMALTVALGVLGAWIGCFGFKSSQGALKSTDAGKGKLSWVSESC